MVVYRNSIYLATIWVKYIPRNTEKCLVCWFLLIFWWVWIWKISDTKLHFPTWSFEHFCCGGSSPGTGCFFPITKLSSSQTQTIHVSASWSSAAEDGWRLCARVRDPIVFQDWQKRLGIWHRFQRAPFLLMVFCWFFVFYTFLDQNEYQWLKPVDGLQYYFEHC